jgi:hypothetical protein
MEHHSGVLCIKYQGDLVGTNHLTLGTKTRRRRKQDLAFLVDDEPQNLTLVAFSFECSLVVVEGSIAFTARSHLQKGDK